MLPTCVCVSQGKRKHQAAHTHVTEQSLTQRCEREIYKHTEAPLYLRDYWREHHPAISPCGVRNSQHDSFSSLEQRFRGTETSHTGNDTVYSNISTDILHRVGMQATWSEHALHFPQLFPGVLLCFMCKLSFTTNHVRLLQTLSLVSNAYIRQTLPSKENKLILVHVPGIAWADIACSTQAGPITCTLHPVLHLKALSGEKEVTHS